MATRPHGVLPTSFAHSLTPAEVARWRRNGWLPPLGGAQDPEDEPGAKPAEKPADEKPVVPAGAENPDAVAKALKAERDARKKAEQETRELREQMAQSEAAGKTEAEKTAERLAALEKANAEAERRATLAETAQAAGVPADILAGPESTSPEDLAAHAERLKAFASAQNEQASAGATPVGDGGARPRPTEASATEMRRLAREDPAEFNRRFDAGEVPAGALGGS